MKHKTKIKFMSDAPPKLYVVPSPKAKPRVVSKFEKIDEFITEAVNEYQRMRMGVGRRLRNQNEDDPRHDEDSDPGGLLYSLLPFQLAIHDRKKFLEDQPEKRSELVELLVQYYRESTRGTLNEKEVRDRMTLLVNITPFKELGDIINTTNTLLKKVVAAS